MKKIVLFEGPDKGFKDIVCNDVDEEQYSLNDLVQELEKTKYLKFKDMPNSEKIENTKTLPPRKNVIIYSNQFESVKEFAYSNFCEGILDNFEIENLFIQNAPIRVKDSISTHFDKKIIKTVKFNYYKPTPEESIQIYKKLVNSKNVIGQKLAKKETCVEIYKSSYYKNKPTVLLYYGNSGVGKTELAKQLSEYFKGKLTRIQFSMMQDSSAVDYLFGGNSELPSFAKDLEKRETNIILIDEFDKVPSYLYNVFYQMFDEAEFEDRKNKVDLRNTIFILTSNFKDEDQIISRLRMPLFSRIDKRIKFSDLTNNEIKQVIKAKFTSIYQNELFNPEDIEIIKSSGIEELYLENSNSFTNVRLLNNIIENDVFKYLFERKLSQNTVQ